MQCGIFCGEGELGATQCLWVGRCYQCTVVYSHWEPSTAQRPRLPYLPYESV